MRGFIAELRRRELFRTAGLYVGIAWIVVEGASVVLPTFDVPDSVLRWVMIIAVIGFPVTLVLAWVFDITDHGIEFEKPSDEADTIVVPKGRRRADFVVMGVLAVALIFSMYLNFSRNPSTGEQIMWSDDPVTVLIADFENGTGDELFRNTLEQAMQIGLEGAPFITAYNRENALRVASTLNEAGDVLDEATARLVSVREGIKLVLTGGIDQSNGRYSLYVRAIDPTGGEILASAEVDANDKLEVLSAVGTLAGDIREELGDHTIERGGLTVSETFTARNLEAAQAYAQAQSLQYRGRYEDSLEHYRRAIEHDPNMGRAHSGLALSAWSLGHTDVADHHWERALASLDTMTERERLRTLGLYYSVVTRNYEMSIDTYKTLVERYPFDDSAHNNLAVQYFMTLRFDWAFEHGGRLLEIYPNNVIGRSNYALYGMYAGDFDMAVDEANRVREMDPTWFKAWLPIAMDAMSNGDFEAALSAYENMTEASPQGRLTGNLGMADVALFTGNTAAARSHLEEGIANARAVGSQYFLAKQLIARAAAEMLEGDKDAALQTTDQALDTHDRSPVTVPAALLFIDIGQSDRAGQIAANLSGDLSPHNRAYGRLIDGLIALKAGDPVSAIVEISAGVEIADLWLLRYWRGRAYLEAGYAAEALDELTAANDRIGEATAIFFDDLPTWRYTVELPYWLGRAQQELGLTGPSRQNYALFIARRTGDHPLATDARERLQTLP
ncbi:MAG: tetratricopeptide repeat protein [Woeseiaceae bacterium]|nr:tetratricopeptide repeat protein [Woeseiaceae bacterium]